MEVMPGYKQTEVGVIPEDWEVCQLQDLTIKSNPITYGVLKPGEYVPNGIPLLQIEDVIHGDIKIDELHRISASLDGQYSRTRLAGGDIVVSLIGTVGKVASIPMELAGANLHRNLARIRISHKNYSGFVFHYLKSEQAQKSIKLTTFGSTQALLNLSDLRALLIAVPPFDEQQAIAEVLSNADVLIELLERLIAKKRLLKQGVMQKLLTGRRRLRGFANATIGYKQTEAGVIPEDWTSWALADLGAWKGGATPFMGNSMFWANGSIPWASSGDIKSVLISDTPMKITEAAIKQSSTTLLPPNSIMIVTRSGILRRYLPVAKNTVPIAINQDIKALVINDNVVADFVLHQLIGNGRRILATCLKTGTTVESIDFSWLRAFKIPLPPSKAEQEAIAAILSTMDAEIALLEAQLAKYRQLKQGLMQKLLTGRIRLV